jgi:hypothetical protein
MTGRPRTGATGRGATRARPPRRRPVPAAAARARASTRGSPAAPPVAVARSARGGPPRARSHCRLVLPFTHFTPDSLTYSVPVSL